MKEMLVNSEPVRHRMNVKIIVLNVVLEQHKMLIIKRL